MTNTFVKRFIIAPFLVAFMVAGSSVHAQEGEESSEECEDVSHIAINVEYCKQDKIKWQKSCERIDRCVRLSPGAAKLIDALRGTSSGTVTSSAAPTSIVARVAPVSVRDDGAVSAAPVAQEEPITEVLAGDSSPYMGEQRFEFPTSHTPSRGNVWGEHIGSSPNRVTWKPSCEAMVEKSSGGKLERLPAWVCEKFKDERDLVPVDDSIVCQSGDMPEGVVITGMTFMRAAEEFVRVMFGVRTRFSSDADRYAKICYVGQHEGRHIYVLKPRKCNNFSYDISDTIKWLEVKKTCTDCDTYRSVTAILYRNEALPADYQTRLASRSAEQGTLAFPRVPRELSMSLHKLGKKNPNMLSRRTHKVRVTLVSEDRKRNIVPGSEEEVGVFDSQNGKVTFRIPRDKKNKTLRLVDVESGWEERCRKWMCDREDCHLNMLIMSMVAS